jgi:hypothetical protein
MPAINFPEYARAIQDVLDATVASGEAALVSVQMDLRSSLRGFIVGLLRFNDDSELHFREFVDTTLEEPRLMYAYHYQDLQKELIFRYDNAAHRPRLPQVEHKHTLAGVETSEVPTLAQVVDEILRQV